MDLTSAFLNALVQPPLLPSPGNSPTIFLGRPYSILEETEQDFLTIRSGGIVEAREQYSYFLSAFPCRMLLYTREGGGVLCAGEGIYKLEEGTLLYFDCNAFPKWEITMTGPLWKYNVFFLTGSRLSSYEKLTTGTEPLLVRVDPYSVILPCLEKLLSLTDGGTLHDKLTDDILLNRILTEVWINALSLTASQKDCPSYLLEIKQSMDTYFMNNFSLQDLEARYHVSKYRICKEFSAAFGVSPLKYLNKRRLEAATNLLLSTDKRVHEISLEVGFETTNHFINLFKRETGMTPQAYRERNRG